MCPIGQHTPNRGAPDDCHCFYDHMDVLSKESLLCLFDHAEVGCKVLIFFDWEVTILKHDSLIFFGDQLIFF